ncbi:MAG: nucleoside recognition protein [Candidatus Sumerlaeia bacterium]|nr:nucleoside recognition protein [Candidatus Sumerlaeia bacterium]
MGVITKSSAHWAGVSITLAIQLIGIMMLWLGLMRVAEKAGLVRFIAKCLKPIMVRLFPELPPESDAMGAIVMNISANMLGLGNAATPLGLKAMQELQELNERKEYASNAMCMLLALNTSSVTLITPAIIGFRVAAGSGNIMQFWPVMIGVTVCSTIAGVAACKALEKMPIFRIPPPQPGELTNEEVKA